MSRYAFGFFSKWENEYLLISYNSFSQSAHWNSSCCNCFPPHLKAVFFSLLFMKFFEKVCCNWRHLDWIPMRVNMFMILNLTLCKFLVFMETFHMIQASCIVYLTNGWHCDVAWTSASKCKDLCNCQTLARHNEENVITRWKFTAIFIISSKCSLKNEMCY